MNAAFRFSVLMFGIISGPSMAQFASAEPTEREIADAYRAKCGEQALLIPRVRWERWCVKDIRGWALKFKRHNETRNVGLVTRRYRVVAKKNDTCAEYLVVDRMPFPPANPQIKPSLVVEPDGIRMCRK